MESRLPRPGLGGRGHEHGVQLRDQRRRSIVVHSTDVLTYTAPARRHSPGSTITPMPPRLVPRAPNWGSNIDADDEPSDDRDIDTKVERESWAAVRPTGSPPAVVQIVDGVRRVEENAIDDLDDGGIAYGLFGSYAVGAVRCEGREARILDGRGELIVGRRYLQTGGDPEGYDIASGATRLRFEAELRTDADTPTDLVRKLHELMTQEEVRLVDALSRDEDVLTITDGRLRRRPTGRRVAGYVKSVQDWYIGASERGLLADLVVGERTPLFLIAGGGEGGSRGQQDRYGWYLRIADMGPHFHHLAGIVRLEASGALPRAEASRLADECALALPRLASSPIRDPRAPQNLTPVGALEDALRHRLGDHVWVRRLIAAALNTGPLPLESQEGGR